jgi:hypothetical protein
MSIWVWFLLGAGSWALAVALKVLADVVVQRAIKAELRDWLASILSGVWSSLCELGLAALAFWFWSATFADALVVATGAALAEFLILLPAPVVANWNKKPQSKAKEAAGWNAFFAERAVIFANHLGSRGLVWLGVAGTGGLAAVGSALGLFALIEAMQAYGQAKEWDWLTKRVLWTYLTVLTAVVAIEIGLLVLWSLRAS